MWRRLCFPLTFICEDRFSVPETKSEIAGKMTCQGMVSVHELRCHHPKRRGIAPFEAAARVKFQRIGAFRKWVVLLERIELSASPLPRECSTTELQQHSMRKRGVIAERPPEPGLWPCRARIVKRGLSRSRDFG